MVRWLVSIRMQLRYLSVKCYYIYIGRQCPLVNSLRGGCTGCKRAVLDSTRAHGRARVSFRSMFTVCCYAVYMVALQEDKPQTTRAFARISCSYGKNNDGSMVAQSGYHRREIFIWLRVWICIRACSPGARELHRGILLEEERAALKNLVVICR